MTHFLNTWLLIAVMVGTSLGATRRVPGDYATIRDAVWACEERDTVLLAPGVYYGQGNVGIQIN